MGRQRGATGMEPVCLGLTLCDHLHQDLATEKFTLSGMFFRLRAARFPTVYPMCMYGCLTDGRGRTPVQIRFVDVNEVHAPVWEASFEVDFDDPDTVFEFGIEISDARLPRPGKYRLQLIAVNATILERSIYVSEGAPE